MKDGWTKDQVKNVVVATVALATFITVGMMLGERAVDAEWKKGVKFEFDAQNRCVVAKNGERVKEFYGADGAGVSGAGFSGAVGAGAGLAEAWFDGEVEASEAEISGVGLSEVELSAVGVAETADFAAVLGLTLAEVAQGETAKVGQGDLAEARVDRETGVVTLRYGDGTTVFFEKGALVAAAKVERGEVLVRITK